MTITLPLPSKGLSPNARLNWRAKHRLTKAARARARLTTLAHTATHGKPTTERPLNYRVQFYWPDARKRDDDNAIAALKAYRDGIADALNIDDHSLTLTGTTHEIDRASPRLEIEIW
jgi:crossover junction endodeoxyribonuclease RusA